MRPFPCGDWPDIEIFCYALKGLLDGGERAEADDGYIGDDPVLIKVPKSVLHNQLPESLFQRACAQLRHETCNQQFKQFKCLYHPFRHDLLFHGTCFRAIAAITQLEIYHGAPLFSVEYNDITRGEIPRDAYGGM